MDQLPPRSKAEHLQGDALQNNAFVRDTRTLYGRTLDSLTDPINNILVQLVVVVIAVMSSFFIWVAPFFLIGIQGVVNSRKAVILSAPYRLPVHSQQGQTDYGQPIPGTGDRKFFKAEGTIYLGNCKITGKQCWVSQQDLLTHSLVLGATGSGKTETLIGYVANILSRGSGVMYIDAKAAPKLYVQIAAIARRLGREDDLLVINYLTGNKEISKDKESVRTAKKLSNTNNPFAKGSADSIIQLLKAFLPGDSGANSIFADKAEAFMQALIYALCDLRDLGNMELGSGVIFKYMELDMIHGLVKNKNNALSEKSRGGLINYMKAGISYDLDKDASEQNDSVTDQHGYAKSYYAKTLSSLQDVYSHIYFTVGGEVDFIDVVLNNRILIVLLPSLEKSEPELSTLAKLNLYGVKNALSPGLGSMLEGNTDSVLHNLPSGGSRTMMLNINDEYGYMAVRGFAVVAAQARGLGLGVVFAGQDFAGFKRADAGEADQIWANTRFKHFMALEDIEAVGKLGQMFKPVKTAMARGYSVQQGSNFLGQYNENQSVEIVDVDRIDPEDVARELEGESHSSLKGKLVRLEAFYANPDIELAFSRKHGENTLFVNRFVFVSGIVKDYIEQRDKHKKELPDNKKGGRSRKAQRGSSNLSSLAPSPSDNAVTTPNNNSPESVPVQQSSMEKEYHHQMTNDNTPANNGGPNIVYPGAPHNDSHKVEGGPAPIETVSPPVPGGAAEEARPIEPILVPHPEDAPVAQESQPVVALSGSEVKPDQTNIEQIILATASSNDANAETLLKYDPSNAVKENTIKVESAGYIDIKSGGAPENLKMSGDELNKMLSGL